MKRALVLAAAAAVALTPVAGQAAPKPPKKTTRVVTFNYTAPCGLFADGVGSLNGSQFCSGQGHTSVQATKTELYMTFEATDSSGQPVGVQMWVNDAYQGGVTYYCSKGKGAYKKGSGKFDFTISVGISGCPGPPSSGTLKVTLSNLP